MAHLTVTSLSCFFFSFSFLGCWKKVFFWPQLLHEFSQHFVFKKINFLCGRGEDYTFEASFLFFLMGFMFFFLIFPIFHFFCFS